MKDLVHIVAKLKSPKDLYNSFGKYKYRSCESILEAVKPLLAERGCLLNLSDSIVCVGNANYVRATATFISSTGQNFCSEGWAREDFEKKGMDSPQMTGTASSYARKYALNGLFCIDDTKDADTNEYREEKQARASQTPVSAKPAKVINDALIDNRERLERMLAWLKGEMAKAGANKRDFSPVLCLKDNGYTFEDSADRRLADIWYQELNNN